MKKSIGNFFKVNIYRVVLLIFMLGAGGFMLTHLGNSIIELIELSKQRYYDIIDYSFAGSVQYFVLVMILYSIMMCNIIVPVVFTVIFLVKSKAEPYFKPTAAEVTGRIFVTLFKMILYGLGSGFFFILLRFTEIMK